MIDLNNNDAIEAANYAANYDANGDGVSDSQYSGLACWACHAQNFEECGERGKIMECSNSQVCLC